MQRKVRTDDLDIDLRSSCFAQLAILCAQWGEDIPVTALRSGFAFRGSRVHYLNPGYGIFRAAVQRGPAALSINSAFIPKRYRDTSTPEGVLYNYQDNPRLPHYNRWLREAYRLRVPVVYFIGTRKSWYRPVFPAFIDHDDPENKRVRVSFGQMVGDPDEPDWEPIADSIERRYKVRQVGVRVHQAQFRGAVLPAYENRCAICSLKEPQLLDAAHIVADTDEGGEPVIPNGVSLCTIHHRAYDQDLVGIAPDRRVHVSRRLLEEEDGPMLELLKGFHGREILLPGRRSQRPDPERLALRFERFVGASS